MTKEEITTAIDGLNPRNASLFLNETDTHAHTIDVGNFSKTSTNLLISDFNNLSEADKESVLDGLVNNIIKPSKHPEGEPA